LEPLKKNLNKFKQILKIVGVGCFFLFSFLFFEIKNLVKTSWFPNGYLDEALLELLRTMFPKNVLNVLKYFEANLMDCNQPKGGWVRSLREKSLTRNLWQMLKTIIFKKISWKKTIK
jgi:hypothetical protein